MIFISPTESTKVSNFFALNPDKNNRPNSVSTRILKSLNKGISDQPVFLFDTSFSFWLFLSILKTSKIIPISKKQKKNWIFRALGHFVYSPILTKFWKDLCLTEFIVFLEKLVNCGAINLN